MVAAYLLLLLALLADLVTGSRTTFSPILAAVPVLAGAGTRSVRVPLLAGGLAAAAVGLLSLANSGISLSVHIAALIAVLAVTLASAANVVLVTARERELREVRTVAEAAQRALLRPVPARVGPLRIAVRYAAAAAEARIGGDLYEVLETPHGCGSCSATSRARGWRPSRPPPTCSGSFARRPAPSPTWRGWPSGWTR